MQLVSNPKAVPWFANTDRDLPCLKLNMINENDLTCTCPFLKTSSTYLLTWEEKCNAIKKKVFKQQNVSPSGPGLEHWGLKTFSLKYFACWLRALLGRDLFIFAFQDRLTWHMVNYSIVAREQNRIGFQMACLNPDNGAYGMHMPEEYQGWGSRH